MAENNINTLVDWFYIFMLFAAVGAIAVITILVVGFIVYIKTGVHIKDWIEEKFPTD